MSSKVNELKKNKYGTFSLVGKVFRIDKGFKEGVSDNTGNDWQSLQFGVQTSEKNTVFVNVMGSVQDEVIAFKRDEEGNSERREFDWDERYDLPEGYHMIGVRCFIEPDGKGKYESANKHPYDAVEYIREYIDNGDVVKIRGQISYSVYTDNNGKKHNQRQLSVNYISKLDSDKFDFNADKFEEENAFTQEMVVMDIETDTKTKKAIVNAYVLNEVKKKIVWVPTDFVIDGNINEQMFKVFPKEVKFGDLIQVSGNIISGTQVEEVVEESDMFGSVVVKGARPANGKRILEYRIMSVDSEKDEAGDPKFLWKKKYYTEDQFVLSKAETDFGSQSPFRSNDDDEDLPFRD